MIRIGPAGWSYADWAGVVYPRKKPKGFHPLHLISRCFDCVEINSSFYALPQAKHCTAWVRHVADRPDFRFTAKLFSGFTHEPVPDDAATWQQSMDQFQAGLEPLIAARRLGAVLAQFPLGFRRNEPNTQRLARISQLLADRMPGIARVLEVRHGSWFGPESLSALEHQGWSLAEIDLPEPPPDSAIWHAPPDSDPVGPLGYLRLHGRNVGTWFDPRAGRDSKYDYLYTQVEVEEMIARARRVAGRRDETYVVTNNHFGGQALVNGLEIASGLARERVPAPADLVRAFPRLAGVTDAIEFSSVARPERPDGQGELFQ